jgi:hypothetical protein
LAFAGANASPPQPSPVPRCGVFAGTEDRETSGCDPNPSRRAQESYGLHLAHALSGLQKDGAKLPLHEIDFDHDGQVGLLDAHTWARIEAVSFDLPTTTSERWLRAVESGSATPNPELAPEDAAVVEKLGRSLELTSEAVAERRWKKLDGQIAAIDAELGGAEAALDSFEDQRATALLERWPVIDDPFHPEFEATFAQNRDAIASMLSDSDLAERRQEARRRAETSYAAFDGLVVAEARVLRLLRAYETLHKAAALQQRGGPAARHYAELLACERASLR